MYAITIAIANPRFKSYNGIRMVSVVILREGNRHNNFMRSSLVRENWRGGGGMKCPLKNCMDKQVKEKQ
jgi:hypothetical protein